MLAALASITIGAAALGAMLGWASVRFRADGNALIDEIEDALPQTQCGQCGFPGCHAYAEAIAGGEEINLCTPGGEAGARRLADLLGRDAPTSGLSDPAQRIALIHEERCIGCTLCLQACPVDAIVGAAKQMHTVIGTLCTGCGLCVPPCPMECIQVNTLAETLDTWKWRYPVVEIRRAHS